MKKEFIWIYIPERKKFQKIAKDDPLLDWDWKHTPNGAVKRYTTKAKGDWAYRYYGLTKQICLDNLNQYDLAKIMELKASIQRIESNLVTLESLGEAPE